MSRRLTPDQLMMMEQLSGREHTSTGSVRKRPRSQKESDSLGISREHHKSMKIKILKIESSGIRSPMLKQILLKAYDL